MNETIKIEEAHKIASLMPALMRRLFTLDDDFAQNLPLAQLRVCSILSKGPLQMSALSRELGISLSAMTQIADRLERAKLVRRVAGRNDRRIRCLQLTPNAEKMMLKRENSRIQSILSVLNSLSPSARKNILTALETFMDASLGVNNKSTSCERDIRESPIFADAKNGTSPEKHLDGMHHKRHELLIHKVIS